MENLINFEDENCLAEKKEEIKTKNLLNHPFIVSTRMSYDLNNPFDKLEYRATNFDDPFECLETKNENKKDPAMHK